MVLQYNTNLIDCQGHSGLLENKALEEVITHVANKTSLVNTDDIGVI